MYDSCIYTSGSLNDKDACKCEESIDFYFLNDENTCDRTSDKSDEASWVDFGKVPVGTTATRVFRVKNDSKNTYKYVVKRDPNTNPIYQVFDFDHYEGRVAPGEYMVCQIIYKPSIPYEVNLDYFEIKDRETNRLKLCVKGLGIGPYVYTSTQCLYFYKIPRLKQTSRTFELKNLSEIDAIYQFDIDERDDGIFKVTNSRGCLKGKSHIYINVTFTPKEFGYYSHNLVLLVLYCEPIIVELVGVFSCQDTLHPEDIVFTRYPLLYNMTGSALYIADSLRITAAPPPVSLSENYLDFGRLVVDQKEPKKLTLVTCLTNHTKTPIEIVWEKDLTFEISPRKVSVPENESVLFECYFHPDTPDGFFSRNLIAQIHWTDTRKDDVREFAIKKITIPLTASLRLIGHSFPVNTSWIPRIQVNPSTILLAPCIPYSLTSSTFMIRTIGHLPVLYKLLPPKKSNFVVKPMVGFIHNYQILVVKLQPDTQNARSFVEQWSIQLNGQENRVVPIIFKGQIEWPRITIGDHNILYFNRIHPGCQNVLLVPMRNMCSFQIRYQFLLENLPFLSIDKPSGDIFANQTIFVEFTITAYLKMPQIVIVKCELMAVEKLKIPVGSPVDTQITIHTKCSYSQLCALPSSCDFGEVQWGIERSTFFHLFNFGKSPIHFNLVYRQSFKPTTEKPKLPLAIEPERGTVYSHEKVKIELKFTPIYSGMYEYNVEYQIRLHEHSDQVINNGECLKIFSFTFASVYPTLQIEDIADHNFGPLFSKINLWEMLKIDEINSVLKNIKSEEYKRVYFSIPDYEADESTFSVSLVVRNVSNFDTSVSLKRRKVCGCKLVMKSIGMSLRSKEYDCPHREMFVMHLSQNTVLANHAQMLDFKIRYLESEYVPMSYVVSLSNDRKIELFVWINTLPKEVDSASTFHYGHFLELKKTYIGLLEPNVQAFWLYNNSANTLTYSVDTDIVQSHMSEWKFPVLRCLNSSGCLPPYTTHAIIFDFMPNESRLYKIDIPVDFSTDRIELHIQGEGISFNKDVFSEMQGTMPQTPQTAYTENPVRLSSDHIIVDKFPVWSITEKMFFITNMTKHRVIGYSWERAKVEGVVDVMTLHRKGVLKPKESHPVVVRIVAFDLPFQLRIVLPCKLLDHTQHYEYAKSIADYNFKKEQLQGQFTITEHGIIYPVNDVIVKPPAQVFHTTIALSMQVVSTPDRDSELQVRTQMSQSPQFDLRLNTERMLRNVESNTGRKSDDFGRLGIKSEDIRPLRDAAEGCLSDVVFSDVFRKIVEKQNKCNAPYYLQMKMSTDDGFYWKYSNSVDEDVKKITKKSNEKRRTLVEHFLSQPPWPILNEVLKELILESVHEVFQLGPPLKERTPLSIFRPRSRYTCGCYVDHTDEC